MYANSNSPAGAVLVGFGSSAAPQNSTTPRAAFGGKADVENAGNTGFRLPLTANSGHRCVAESGLDMYQPRLFLRCHPTYFPGTIMCAAGVPANMSHGRKGFGIVERPVDFAVAPGK